MYLCGSMSITSYQHSCGIKGISAADSQAVIEERLKHMKLWNVRDQRSTTYSGGMKRRLSVILSTLGDPQCVFLGMLRCGFLRAQLLMRQFSSLLR